MSAGNATARLLGTDPLSVRMTRVRAELRSTEIPKDSGSSEISLAVVFFERNFRMGTDPMLPLSHLDMGIGDPIDDWHSTFLAAVSG
jgi:hypothetical protein